MEQIPTFLRIPEHGNCGYNGLDPRNLAISTPSLGITVRKPGADGRGCRG